MTESFVDNIINFRYKPSAVKGGLKMRNVKILVPMLFIISLCGSVMAADSLDADFISKVKAYNCQLEFDDALYVIQVVHHRKYPATSIRQRQSTLLSITRELDDILTDLVHQTVEQEIGCRVQSSWRIGSRDTFGDAAQTLQEATGPIN